MTHTFYYVIGLSVWLFVCYVFFIFICLMISALELDYVSHRETHGHLKIWFHASGDVSIKSTLQ